MTPAVYRDNAGVTCCARVWTESGASAFMKTTVSTCTSIHVTLHEVTHRVSARLIVKVLAFHNYYAMYDYVVSVINFCLVIILTLFIRTLNYPNSSDATFYYSAW